MKYLYFFLFALLAGMLYAEENLLNLSKSTLTREKKITAFTQAIKTMELSSEVSAKVLNAYFDEGQHCIGSEQQVLVYQLDHTQADLQLQKNASQIQDATQKISLAEITLQTLEYDKSLKEKEFNRSQKLIRKKQISQVVFDKRELSLTQAQLMIKEQLIQLKIAKNNLKQLQLEKHIIRDRIYRHKVFAPKGWVVLNRFVEPGEIAQAGQVLLNCAKVSELKVELFLSEKEIQAIKAQESISLLFKHQNIKHPAKLAYVSSEYKVNLRKRKVVLYLKDLPISLQSGGLEVEYILSIPQGISAYQIPKNYLLTSYEENFVLDQKKERIKVQVLKTDEERYHIGSNELHEGLLIQPIP